MIARHRARSPRSSRCTSTSPTPTTSSIVRERAARRTACRCDSVRFHHIRTNECWCRDHGPAFVLRTRRGRTRGGHRRLGLQRLGRQVSAVGRRRCGADARRRGAGPAGVPPGHRHGRRRRSTSTARARADHRRRACSTRTAIPTCHAGRDRAATSRTTTGRSTCLARRGHRGRRHRRPRRRPRPLHRRRAPIVIGSRGRPAATRTTGCCRTTVAALDAGPRPGRPAVRDRRAADAAAGRATTASACRPPT